MNDKYVRPPPPSATLSPATEDNELDQSTDSLSISPSPSSSPQHVSIPFTGTRTRQVYETLIEEGRLAMASRYLDFTTELQLAREQHWRLQLLLERYEQQAKGKGETLREIAEQIAREGE